MNQDFSLEDHAEYWSMGGIIYRGKIVAVDISKQPLPARTQDEHAAHAKESKDKNRFYCADLPIYFALKSCLYDNGGYPGLRDSKGDPRIEKIRRFISDQMGRSMLITLTRVIYTPTGKDRIVHNYGLSDQQEILEDLVDQEGSTKINNSKIYQSLLETNNPEFQGVYFWLTGGKIRLFRSSKKPEREMESPIRFFSEDNDYDYIDCLNDPETPSPALGVRIKMA